MNPRIGGTRYQTVRFIARGSQGSVHEAWDRFFGSRVALKIYQGVLDIETLTQEFRLIRDIKHRNIVWVYDLMVEDNQAILAMELFDRALSEKDVRRADGRLDVDAVRELHRSLFDGLKQLHARGIVHGDVKPSNVLVKNSRFALSDFGLSRRVDDRRRRGFDGTPRYSAPELFIDERPSPASDVFSAGLVLIEMASSIRPQIEDLYGRPRVVHPWLKDRESLRDAFPDTWSELLDALAVEPKDRPQTYRPPKAQPNRLPGDSLPFVGRDKELELFSALERKAEKKKSWVRFDVSAPSGLGKSRLLRETAARQERRAIYLSCHPNEAMPFALTDALLEEISRRDVHGARELAAEAGRWRRRLFQISRQVHAQNDFVLGAVVDFFEKCARAETPLILLVDDAHWGDEDSGRLLSALLQSMRTPFVLGLGYRPEGAWSPLLRALSRHVSDARILLEPLVDADVLRLIEARDDPNLRMVPPGRILERCDGHPFLATYLGPQDFLLEGTETVAVQRRFEAIHKNALDLALLIRAAGCPLTRDVLLSGAERIVNEADAAFQALLASGMIRRAGEKVALTHERLLEPLWAAFAPGRRAVLHEALARGLRETRAPAEQVATQAYLSGNLREAEIPARDAAERAFSIRAFDQAAKLASIAFEAAVDRGDWSKAHQLRRMSAEAHSRAGDARAAAQQYLELAAAYDPMPSVSADHPAGSPALRASEGPGDDAEVVHCELKAAENYLRAGDIEQAGRIIKRTGKRLGLAFPRSFPARIARMLIERLRLFGLDLSKVDPSPSEDPNDRIGLRMAYDWLLAFRLGAFEAHPAAQARLLRLAAKTNRPNELVRALALEMVYAAVFGFRSRWLSKVEALLERSSKKADPSVAAFSAFAFGFADLMRGRLRSARERFGEAADLASSVPSAPALFSEARLHGFACSALIGDLEDALPEGLAARRVWLAEREWSLVARFDTFTGFHQDLLEGRPRYAIRRLREAALGPHTSSLEYVRIYTLSGVLHAAGRSRAARRLLAKNWKILAAKSFELYASGAIAWFVFIALADVPRLSILRLSCLRALALWCGACRHPAARGLAKAMQGMLHLRSGRPERGVECLKGAWENMVDLGMMRQAAALAELLEAAGTLVPKTELSDVYQRAHPVWRRWFRPTWPEKGL